MTKKPESNIIPFPQKKNDPLYGPIECDLTAAFIDYCTQDPIPTDGGAYMKTGNMYCISCDHTFVATINAVDHYTKCEKCKMNQAFYLGKKPESLKGIIECDCGNIYFNMQEDGFLFCPRCAQTFAT